MFVHQKNIKNKISTNYKNLGEKFQDWLLSYDIFLKSIRSIDDNKIKEKKELVEEYIKKAKDFGDKHKIDTRSKFISTIYEELPIYFLESKLKKYRNKKIGVFSKNIISSLNIDHNSEIHFKYKDVDLCFGKEVKISIEGRMQNIVVPIIAIEVKTYLDRTMLNEAEFSAAQLKGINPKCKCFIMASYNDVGKESLPTKEESYIDQFYFLGGKKDKGAQINLIVIQKLIEDIQLYLEKVFTSQIEIDTKYEGLVLFD